MLKERLKRASAGALLVLCLLLFTGCMTRTSPEHLSDKLRAYLQDAGFSIVISPMDESREAPIYKPKAWECWSLDGEELLVYFDESNRADYLSSGIDPKFGQAWRFGLRYVLVYAGSDARVLDALNAIPTD